MLRTDTDSAPDITPGTRIDLSGAVADPRADDLVAAVLAWPDADDGSVTLRANMVASLDGGTTLDGHSGGLGSPVDQRLMGIQRDLADVVLVGAGTVIAENYPGASRYPRRVARRERWGREGIPRWAIVASRPLPDDLRAVVEGDERALVICPDGVPQPPRAEVITTGKEQDLAAGLRALAERGLTRVLCEGGPTLLGRLAAADLVDELSITVSPTVLGTGDTVPLLGDEQPAAVVRDPAAWQLVSLFSDGDHLFPRYRRRR